MHTASRKTSWVKPEGYDDSKASAPVDEWLELKDPKSDRVYFMNAATRRTSWVKPKTHKDNSPDEKNGRDERSSANNGGSRFPLTMFIFLV